MQTLASSDKFTALLDAAVDGIFVIDRHGIIEVANQAVERMLGYAQDELIGHNVSMLMPSPDREAHDGYLSRYLETGEAKIIGKGRDVAARHKDGSSIQIYLSVGRYDSESDTKFVGIIQDRSKLNEVTAELEHAELEIHELVNQLAHSSRVGVMGEMAASIAHEINQPLTAISTYANAATKFAATDTSINSEVVAALEKISQQALRAGEIISSLRSWIREQDTKRERCNCNQLIRNVADIVRMEAQNNDVELQLELEPNLPDIDCDPVQVQQVILNLIKNSIDAINEKSDEDAQVKRLIAVKSESAEQDRIRVTITDFGTGITGDAADKVFNAFYSTKQSGMGMGLSICRTIIRTHGGDLSFHNNPSGGVSFYFTLPATVNTP